ncbi:ankyrin repeat domain-containing protein [Spirochaetota bacterium]
MKILVTATAQNAAAAKSIMISLEQKGFDTTGLKFNPHWQTDTISKLENHLYNTGHVLLVADKSTFKESWPAFIVGLCTGKSLAVYIYQLEELESHAKWLGDIPLYKSLDQLLERLSIEASGWEEKVKRSYAKAALLEMGISWHSESFAQCIKDGDIKAVQLFIDSGFPASIRDKTGVPMANLAARAKHPNILKMLLEQGADINIQSDDRAYSPLMDAVQQGDSRLIDFLLEKGADPDLQSKDGQTALVLAVGRNDVSAVKSLLQFGANPDLADNLGLSARKYAKLFRNPEIEAAFQANTQ